LLPSLRLWVHRATFKKLIKIWPVLRSDPPKTVPEPAQSRNLSPSDFRDGLSMLASRTEKPKEQFRSLTETKPYYKINNMEAVLSKLIKF